MTKETLKLALEALEEAWYHVGTFQPTEKAIDLYDEARTAIKEALAQTQEPVAWGVFDDNLHDMFFAKEEAQEMVRLKGDGSTVKPLYTTPSQIKVGCAECGVNGNHALYCVACAEKYLEDKNTKGQK